MSSSDQNGQPPQPPALPPGETDPNQLYIAVGRAIHAWENMEEALARLFLTLTGSPDAPPHALTNYGAENRIFIDRVAALKAAAEEYPFPRSTPRRRDVRPS